PNNPNNWSTARITFPEYSLVLNFSCVRQAPKIGACTNNRSNPNNPNNPNNWSTARITFQEYSLVLNFSCVRQAPKIGACTNRKNYLDDQTEFHPDACGVPMVVFATLWHLLVPPLL